MNEEEGADARSTGRRRSNVCAARLGPTTPHSPLFILSWPYRILSRFVGNYITVQRCCQITDRLTFQRQVASDQQQRAGRVDQRTKSFLLFGSAEQTKNSQLSIRTSTLEQQEKPTKHLKSNFPQELLREALSLKPLLLKYCGNTANAVDALHKNDDHIRNFKLINCTNMDGNNCRAACNLLPL